MTFRKLGYRLFFAIFITTNFLQTGVMADNWRTEIEQINGEIIELKGALEKDRKHALNEEVSAQGHLRFASDKFIDETKGFEEDKEHIQKIKERIEVLNLQKQTLINQHLTDQ